MRSARLVRLARFLALLAVACAACAKPESKPEPAATSAVPAPSQAPSARPADAFPRCDAWGCTVHTVTPEVRAAVLAAPHGLILAFGSGKSQIASAPRPPSPGAPWTGVVLPANTWITFDATATYDDVATISLLPETKALVIEPTGPGPLDLSPLTTLHGLLWLKVDAALTSVAPLASLGIESLFLNTTVSIGDPAPLGNLHSLRDLTVFALPSLEAIAPLTGLQRLKVGGRTLTSLKGLAALKLLTLLDVSSCPVTDVAPVAALTELRSLTLDHLKITALPDLSALKDLASLDLRGDDLTDLAHLPRPSPQHVGLQTLALASNKRLKDLAPLASLTNLGSLDIRDTAVTSLAPLASLKMLRSLSVSKDFPASEVDTLKKSLPDLRVER